MASTTFVLILKVDKWAILMVSDSLTFYLRITNGDNHFFILTYL